METASTSNERTPLLGDVRIDISTNEETPLDGNNIFKEKQPLDRNQLTPRSRQGETNQFSVEEAVQAMCAAWRQHRQPEECALYCRLSEEQRTRFEFFSVKQAYAMRVAWQNLTGGRESDHVPHIIGEAVGAAIAKELLPVPQCDEDDTDADFQMQFAIKKNIITASFLEYWYGFEEEINDVLHIFPFRYIETMSRESVRLPPLSSPFWYRQVELYDKVHDFFYKPKLQLLLHSLLFIWPLTFLIIGSRYMECSIGHLSLQMMAVGCVGVFATLFRLAMMYLQQVEYFFTIFWKWKFLRLIELTFLILFFIQMFHFFHIDPKTEPDPDQCAQDFYNAALVINYASIPLASVYVFAYSIVICLSNFDIWIWIVRRF